MWPDGLHMICWRSADFGVKAVKKAVFWGQLVERTLCYVIFCSYIRRYIGSDKEKAQLVRLG